MSEYKLVLGDCLEYMRGLEDGAFDCIVTDPPYGIGGIAARPWNTQRRNGMVDREWDDAPADVSWLLSYDVPTVIWGGNYFGLPPSRCWLAWIKPDAPPSMGGVEYAWTNFDRNSDYIIQTIAATNPERVGHPTQKPLRVMCWIIENYTFPGDTIVDPYMGSGTTGVAALRLGRNFLGYEIDPNYFAIAERRISEAARQPALFVLDPQPKPEQREMWWTDAE